MQACARSVRSARGRAAAPGAEEAPDARRPGARGAEAVRRQGVRAHRGPRDHRRGRCLRADVLPVLREQGRPRAVVHQGLDATRSCASSRPGRPASRRSPRWPTPFRASLRALTADEGPADESAYLLVIKLIDTTPSLLAALLRYLHDRDEETVRVLAEREGVDPDTDRRPRLCRRRLHRPRHRRQPGVAHRRRRERRGDARRVRGQRRRS